MQRNKINDIILENMQEQVYVRDLDMNITYINPAAEKLTGWTLKDALGKKCHEIFGDEKMTCKDVCPIEKVIADKLPIYHHEGKLRTRYGDVKDMKVSISPIIENDSAIGAVVVMNDITSLKELEKTNVKNLIALAQEKKMFIKGPVVIFKWKNQPGWPVEYVSDNVEDVTGYSTKEWNLQEVSYADIIFKEDKLQVIDEVVQNSESGAKCFDHEPYRLVKKDGSVIWVLDYTTIIRDDSGEITHYQGYLIDITQYKNAHQLLKETESRYQTLTESINTIPWKLDLSSGNFTYMAPQVEKILGYSADSWLDINTWAERIHPEDRHQAVNYCNIATQQGKNHAFKYRAVAADGQEVWINDIVTVKMGDDGPKELLGAMIDITQEKQTEEKLQKSESRLKAAEKMANIGNWEFDLKTDVLQWSDEVYNIFEIDPSKFKVSYEVFFNTIHPEDREFVDKTFKESVANKIAYNIDHRLLFKDGRIKFVNEHCRTYYDEQGNALYSLGTVQDITERTLAQEREKRLFNDSLIGIMTVDKNAVIIKANAALENMFGYPKDAMIGKKIPELLVPENVAKFRKHFKRRQMWIADVFEFAFIREDGSELICEISAVPTMENGDFKGVSGFFQDITKRKRIEKALKISRETLETKVKERTAELKDINNALTVLLEKRERDKKDLEGKIFSNYKLLVSPFLQKLKTHLTKKNHQDLLNILESNLNEFLQPFSQKLSDPMVNLTPSEIQIASMVKQGMSNKEIAQTLNNSVRTITNHRQKIRIKLGLQNKKINLRSYLSSL